MKHYDGQALGFIETIGMVPALKATDEMLKAANVELISYENIGSTLVTVVIKGDVAAVHTAVETGAKAAGAIGRLTASHVMARPIPKIYDIVSIYGLKADGDKTRKSIPATGLIETFGLVFILEAADAMEKTAGVDVVGFENVASGYISILVQGDVSACQAAVDAATQAVEEIGGEVYSSTVIASPHPDLEKIMDLYTMDKL